MIGIKQIIPGQAMAGGMARQSTSTTFATIFIDYVICKINFNTNDEGLVNSKILIKSFFRASVIVK